MSRIHLMESQEDLIGYKLCLEIKGLGKFWL